MSRYRVGYPSEARRNLERWLGLAAEFGLQPALAADLAEMDRRLAEAPHKLGDPTFNWKWMHAIDFTWMTDRIIVRYAVHDSEPVVLVRSIELRPGSRLWLVDDAPPA